MPPLSVDTAGNGERIRCADGVRREVVRGDEAPLRRTWCENGSNQAIDASQASHDGTGRAVGGVRRVVSAGAESAVGPARRRASAAFQQL